MLDQITAGRTDLVFEYLAQGHAASSQDAQGVSLMQWCAYYGDVSAIRYLLAHGESRSALDDQLNAAAFHGHWRLCQFLLETGAKVNQAETATGETALHAATSKGGAGHDRVVRALLAAGADPNAATIRGAETGAFMRDCRTRGETPLHRAAAFASEPTVQLLLDSGANREARDVNGDSPLSWGSWHGRPDSILRRLCYGKFHIRLERLSMEAYLLGEPHSSSPPPPVQS
jgi:ankyrin repeat protein